MIEFNNIEELNKVLRQMLITQSELSPERVLNALSVYGTELDKLLEDNIYESIDRFNATLLFELSSRDATSDMSMEEDTTVVDALTCSRYNLCNGLEVSDDLKVTDSSLTSYKAFKLNVIIYGIDSTTIAQKLFARFNSEFCRTLLYQQGIYLESVSQPAILNEFKNNTMWLRNDMTINIAVKQNISQITSDDDYEQLSAVTIIENK